MSKRILHLMPSGNLDDPPLAHLLVISIERDQMHRRRPLILAVPSTHMMTLASNPAPLPPFPWHYLSQPAQWSS